MTGVCPNQYPKSTITKKKPTNLCTPRKFLKLSAVFTILLLCLSNKQTFHMFSLRDLRCSIELNVLRAQRIMGFLITHKSTRWKNRMANVTFQMLDPYGPHTGTQRFLCMKETTGINSIKKYKCTSQVGPLFLQIHTKLNPLKVFTSSC